MFNDPGMKVFPPLFWTENKSFAQELSINWDYAWPTHKFCCHKAFDQIAETRQRAGPARGVWKDVLMQFQFAQSWINV